MLSLAFFVLSLQVPCIPFVYFGAWPFFVNILFSLCIKKKKNHNHQLSSFDIKQSIII